MTDLKEFERFWTRDGFNKSLGHFKTVLAFIDKFCEYENLADLINVSLSCNAIMQHQIAPVLYSLLVDKYAYKYDSFSLRENYEDFVSFTEEIKKWNGVDVVITYYNPDMGQQVINPKNENSWTDVRFFKRNELITVFAGEFHDHPGDKIAEKAIETIKDFLKKKNIKTDPGLLKGKYRYKAIFPEQVLPEKKTRAAKKIKLVKTEVPSVKSRDSQAGEAPAAAVSAVKPQASAASETSLLKKRMTPLYAIPVTNELFHNGNVEAWKKIIQSYNSKYPDLKVLIYYEGERILDINTLFKWGKVKHGSSIMFAVAGADIKDVAKLQRYLTQGASVRFEDFLRFPMNVTLKLF